MNAGRDEAIGHDDLVRCLHSDRADPRWSIHMKTLLGAEEAAVLQDLVYGGLCEFSDIVRQLGVWGVEPNLLFGWLGDMAASEAQTKST